jgi:pimeloyl-ACP methyl ester carboxylesterase
VDVDRGVRRLHVEVDGERGERLVILPNCREPWGSAVWAHELAASFLVARVDLNGFGRSDTDPAAFGLEGAVDDVLAVADALASPRLSVWGYAGNAPVALGAAMKSDRVDAVVAGGFPLFAASPPMMKGSPGKVGYFWDNEPFRVGASQAILADHVGTQSPHAADAFVARGARVLTYFVRGDRVLNIGHIFESNRQQLEGVGVEVVAIDVPGSARMRPEDAHNVPVTTDPHASLAIVVPFLEASAR